MTKLRAIAGGLWTLVRKYPVRAQAIVQASLGTATAFGLHWDGGQVGSVVTLSAVILAFITEQAVTPLSEPIIPAGTQVTVTTPAGQPDTQVVV